jgi:hypothetical protein
MTQTQAPLHIYGAYQAMFAAAAEVILLRTGQMLMGAMSGSEAREMVSEKADAFSNAAQAAAVAACTGDPMRVAMAVPAPYERQVALNIARLRA